MGTSFKDAKLFIGGMEVIPAHHVVYEYEGEPMKWYFQIPDYHGDDDWEEIRKYEWQTICDHEDAAALAAEQHDTNGDYSIIRNEGIDKILIKNEEGVVKAFEMYAKTIAHYGVTKEIK